MWPKLTQGYKVQDVGPAQSGNNLLGLIKAAHSQVSWADFCKMKMIFIKNQKAECRTHHSIHSLPTTAGALGQQLPGCLSQATAKFKGVMYDYVKSNYCTQKNCITIFVMQFFSNQAFQCCFRRMQGQLFQMLQRCNQQVQNCLSRFNQNHISNEPVIYPLARHNTSHNLVMFCLFVDQVS